MPEMPSNAKGRGSSSSSGARRTKLHAAENIPEQAIRDKCRAECGDEHAVRDAPFLAHEKCSLQADLSPTGLGRGIQGPASGRHSPGQVPGCSLGRPKLKAPSVDGTHVLREVPLWLHHCPAHFLSHTYSPEEQTPEERNGLWAHARCPVQPRARRVSWERTCSGTRPLPVLALDVPGGRESPAHHRDRSTA